MLILICLLKWEWGFWQAPIVRLSVRLDFFEITSLNIEAQGIGLVIVPIAGICPNAASEYQGFADEVNDAFLRVIIYWIYSPWGNFNAYAGTVA